MYFSINRFTGDSVTTQWELNFAGGYISQDHVKVLVTSIEGVETTPAFTWVNATTVSISPAVANGSTIEFYRDTPKDLPLVDYTDGAIVNEKNLDKSAQQAIFVAAETTDRLADIEVLVGTAVGDAAASAAAALAAQIAAEVSETAASDSAAEAVAAAALVVDAAAHAARTDNPHATTKAQVGLGNVDNTADADKPVSAPQATAIATAISDHVGLPDPHGQYVELTELAASTGAALVGTIASGAGVVSRTVAAKLRDVISVFDYMTPTEIAAAFDPMQTAVNHATAITTALQNAKRVYFPDGTTFYMGTLVPNQVAVNCSTFGDGIALVTGKDVEFKCTSGAGISTFFRFDQNNGLYFGNAKFSDYGRVTADQDAGNLEGAVGIDIAGTGVAWGDITIGHLRGDLLISCVRVFSSDSAHYSARIRDIRIDSIHAEDCYYGYNGQQNGDIVRIGQIYARAAYRAYFVYGVSDHEVRVVARNSRMSTGTVNISRNGLNNTAGIKVRYSADGEVADHIHVNVNHVGPDLGSITGVELDLDIRDGSGFSNEAVKIVTYDMSGGVETGTALGNAVGIRVRGTALGTSGVITTAAYTTTQIGGVDVNLLLTADNTTLSTFRGAQASNTYTPAWTAASVNPTLGNGTITGSFQVKGGVCHCAIDLNWGSTTTGGTGVWSFSLPVTPAMGTILGQGRITDAGTNFQLCVAFIVGNTLQVYSHGGAAALQGNVPIVWTTGDRLVLSISYPI